MTLNAQEQVAADAFLHGMRLCKAFLHLSNTAPSKYEAKIFAGPIMILSAFASEVLLKSLVCLETGKLPKGHELAILFDALSLPVRQKIEHRWTKEIIPLRDRMWKATEAHFNETIDRDLRAALVAGSNAFIQMRYRYEAELGQKTRFYINDLPIALQKVIYEIKPEWRQLTWHHQTLSTTTI